MVNNARIEQVCNKITRKVREFKDSALQNGYFSDEVRALKEDIKQLLDTL